MEKNLPLWLACAAVYYSAREANRPPMIVPDRIRVHSEVRSNGAPDTYRAGVFVPPGEHECVALSWGDVFAKASDGQGLKLRPGEFRVLSWRTASASDPLTLEFCLKALGLEAHQFQVHRQINVTGEPLETAASLWDAFSPIIYGVLQTFENRQQRIATFSYFLAAIGGGMCAEFGRETALRMLVALEQGILEIEEAEVH